MEEGKGAIGIHEGRQRSRICMHEGRQRSLKAEEPYMHTLRVIHPIIVTPNHSDPFIVTFIQSNIVTSLRANQ